MSEKVIGTGKMFGEITLSDGTFARVYGPALGDWAVTYNTNPLVHMLFMLARIVTIDGEQKDVAYYTSLSVAVGGPLIKLVSEAVGEIGKYGKGVA